MMNFTRRHSFLLNRNMESCVTQHQKYNELCAMNNVTVEHFTNRIKQFHGGEDFVEYVEVVQRHWNLFRDYVDDSVLQLVKQI